MPDTASSLDDWIGRGETTEDILTPRMAAHMTATLDCEQDAPGPGEPLPPGWHWMLCAPGERPDRLGPDGLPAQGGMFPPLGLPRRMWAGVSTTILKPLIVGDTVTRHFEISKIAQKEGRSGKIAFVTVRHVYSGSDGPAIEEDLNIAFREEAKPGEQPPPPAPAPAEAVWRRTITPDPVLLYRYSALTFNGHRIHYDQPYVTQVEGYPGLLVHGPLITTLLYDLLRRSTDRAPKTLNCRAMRPLYDTTPFEVCGAPAEDGEGAVLWALDPEGAVAMQVEVGF